MVQNVQRLPLAWLSRFGVNTLLLATEATDERPTILPAAAVAAPSATEELLAVELLAAAATKSCLRSSV